MHARNSRDASDLCDKGLLQATVKLRQRLLYLLKLVFCFPSGSGGECFGLSPNSNTVCILTLSPFPTLSEFPIMKMGSLIWKMSL